MKLTALQKETCIAIQNVLRTGNAFHDYSHTAQIEVGFGWLEYGISRATLGSGRLGCLMEAYCSVSETRIAEIAATFLPQVREPDYRLQDDQFFVEVLRDVGQDPVMQRIQRDDFERRAWRPSQDACCRSGWVWPLTAAVVYDAFDFGGFSLTSRETMSSMENPKDVGEIEFMRAFVAVRRAWMLEQVDLGVECGEYRLYLWTRLHIADNWALALPITVGTTVITEGELLGTIEKEG